MSLRPLENSGRLNKRELITALAEELKKTKERVGVLQEKVDLVESKLDTAYENQDSLEASFRSRREANNQTISALRREIHSTRLELEEAAILDDEDAARYLELLSPSPPAPPEVRVVGATPRGRVGGEQDEESSVRERDRKATNTPPPRDRAGNASPPPLNVEGFMVSNSISKKERLDERLKRIAAEVDKEVNERMEKRKGKEEEEVAVGGETSVNWDEIGAGGAEGKGLGRMGSLVRAFSSAARGGRKSVP